MIVPDLMMFATAYAPSIHPTKLSAVVMQKSRGDLGTIDINGGYKLLHQPSTFKKAIMTAEQLKRSGYSFDAGLGQINIKSFKWLCMSLSGLFNPCKNLQAVQTVSVHCYERTALKYSFEQDALQTALSYYKIGDFKHGFINQYVQKIVSHVGTRIPTFISMNNGEREYVQSKTAAQKQTVKVKPSVVPQKELADAFKSKASSAQDVFTEKTPSSFKDNEDNVSTFMN
ncbi:lytic transglycosylase domain-containing protein [Bartonella sp. B30(2025)]